MNMDLILNHFLITKNENLNLMIEEGLEDTYTY